jgi:mono/diheme cytochrome c family protein
MHKRVLFFVGHAVLRDHHLVTNAAYVFIRHLVYLGAFLIWLGVGVGSASGWALLVAVLYVIPAYLLLLYMRDEEAMLDEAFGDAHRRYRGSVARLIPQLRRRPVATFGACALLLLLLSVVPVHAGEHPGQSLYLRYCAACHGRQGRGDGPVASALGEKPTDLTQLAATHGEEFPLQVVLDAIDGTRTVRAHGVSEMPVWGEVFRPDPASPKQKLVARRKIVAIADYLRSLQGAPPSSH